MDREDYGFQLQSLCSVLPLAPIVVMEVITMLTPDERIYELVERLASYDLRGTRDVADTMDDFVAFVEAAREEIEFYNTLPGDRDFAEDDEDLEKRIGTMEMYRRQEGTP